MPRMPGATWAGEHGSSRMTQWDVVCEHTIAGYAPAHAAHFSVFADGRIVQSRDTIYKSAANLNGNYRVIAVENEDHGPAFGTWSKSDVPALTPAQVQANARILRWAHDVHGVPLQLCPNSLPTSRGLAYHRQGIDGNFPNGRVPGGEVWSKSTGKVCPGDRRIAQLPEILRLAKGGAPPTEEEDMPLNDADKGWISGQIMRALSWLATGQGNAFVNVKTAPWTATAPSLTSLAARTVPALIAQVEGDPQVWLVNPAGGTKVKLNGWDAVDVAVFLGASQAGPHEPHKLPANYMDQLAEIA